MARQRDYGAERAARDQRYYDLGYRGAGGGVKGAYNAFDGMRRKGQAEAGERRQVFNVGGRQIARTNPAAGGGVKGAGVVQAALSGALGRQVKVSVVYDGKRYDILSKGGWNGALVWQRLYGVHGGDVAAFAADQLASVLAASYIGGDDGVDPGDIEEVQVSW